MYFENFRQDYSNGGAVFDDKRELNLALEVADIVDELKMIKNLLDKQRIVVGALNPRMHRSGYIGHYYEEHIARAEIHLESVLSNANEIKSEAEETYKSVSLGQTTRKTSILMVAKLMELLDLKAKTATLAEARSTTKQEQAVMLFTIVTIIFVSHSTSSTIAKLTNPA